MAGVIGLELHNTSLVPLVTLREEENELAAEAWCSLVTLRDEEDELAAAAWYLLAAPVLAFFITRFFLFTSSEPMGFNVGMHRWHKQSGFSTSVVMTSQIFAKAAFALGRPTNILQ